MGAAGPAATDPQFAREWRREGKELDRSAWEPWCSCAVNPGLVGWDEFTNLNISLNQGMRRETSRDLYWNSLRSPVSPRVIRRAVLAG